MMFAFLIPYCLGGIAGPSLQSVLSVHVPPNQQGELQGALTSLMSLTTIIGPPLMSFTFSYFTTDKARFIFRACIFIGALCMFMSIIIIYKVLSKEKKKDQHPTYSGRHLRSIEECADALIKLDGMLCNTPAGC